MSHFSEDASALGLSGVISSNEGPLISPSHPIAMPEGDEDRVIPSKVTKKQMKSARDELFQLIIAQQTRIRNLKHLKGDKKEQFISQLQSLIDVTEKSVQEQRTASNWFLRNVWPAQLAEINKSRRTALTTVNHLQSESERLNAEAAEEARRFPDVYRVSSEAVRRLAEEDEGAETGPHANTSASTTSMPQPDYDSEANKGVPARTLTGSVIALRDQGMRLGEKIMSQAELDAFQATIEHTASELNIEGQGSGLGSVGLPPPMRIGRKRPEGDSPATQATESQTANTQHPTVGSANALVPQASQAANMGRVHAHKRTDTVATADTFGVVGGWRSKVPPAIRADSRMSDVSGLSSQEGSNSQHGSVDHLSESHSSDALAENLEGMSLDEAREAPQK